MKNVLYCIELSEEENFVQYLKFIDILSIEKQKHIHKLRFDADKKLSLFSDLFVRYFACKSLNLRNADLLFEKNVYGKPYLAGWHDFHYNVSHTRNAIAVGFSETPIGVDIEKLRSVDLKIAERFFCKNELVYILSKAEERECLFYEVWTKKEAYIKWAGKGLSLPLDTFDTTDVEIDNILSSIVINGYIISVCSQNNNGNTDFITLKENRASQIFTEFVY